MSCCCLVAKSCAPISLSLWPPWTVANWAPLFTGFPRLEYWSWLPFPTPEMSPDVQAKFRRDELAGRALDRVKSINKNPEEWECGYPVRLNSTVWLENRIWGKEDRRGSLIKFIHVVECQAENLDFILQAIDEDENYTIYCMNFYNFQNLFFCCIIKFPYRPHKVSNLYTGVYKWDSN